MKQIMQISFGRWESEQTRKISIFYWNNFLGHGPYEGNDVVTQGWHWTKDWLSVA